MTTIHHTPHAVRFPFTSAEINRPLSELDSALADILVAGSATSTTLTAQALAGQASLTVASSGGFAVGDPIYIGDGTTFESRIVATVPNGTTITVTVNLTNTYAIGRAVAKSPIEIVDARGGQATLGARLSLFDRWAYDVRRFGAVGDGVADDLAAIHAARDAAAAAGGGTIFLPDGRYKVSAGVVLNVAQVGMAGVGQGSVLLTTADITVVKVTAASVQLEDFAIEMPVGGNIVARRGVEFETGAGLECAARRLSISGGYRSIFGQNCNGVTIEGCRVTTYTHDGIYVGGNCDRWSVVGNECFAGCTNIPAGTEIGGGIFLNGAAYCLVEGNVCRDNGTASPNGGVGIWVNVGHRNRIIGNTCVSNGKPAQDLNGQGIILAGLGGSKYNVVAGNICESNTAEGITIYQAGTSFNTISGNVCKGNRLSQIEIWEAEFNTISGNLCVDSLEGVGIMLNKTDPTGSDYCTITGNICRNNRQNGIQVTSAARVAITGNQCIDNNRGNSALAHEGSGISVDNALETVVNGNICRDTSAAAKLQIYGLNIANASTVIGGHNNFGGNLTGEINNSQLISGIGHGYTELTEVSDPAAPATNKGRLYVRDNGAGKTQLVVRFPTGAIQVISTEP